MNIEIQGSSGSSIVHTLVTNPGKGKFFPELVEEDAESILAFFKAAVPAITLDALALLLKPRIEEIEMKERKGKSEEN